jgi:transposase InsO family protein
VKYAFIQAEKARFPVKVLCRVLGVSRSGFYGAQTRAPSTRARVDADLGSRIEKIHRDSNQTYGSPRIHDQLKDDDVPVSRKRVARLMRERELKALPRRRFRKTTDSSHSFPIAPNLLQRDFAPIAPDLVWAADITYVWTWQGWMYLAVVLDLFSRRVVGWALAEHMRTELVVSALTMALGRRKPERGLVHHSDRGSQYASTEYRELLAQHGIECSMSRKGDCWDNAVVESFFGTLKAELLDRCSWPTHEDTRIEIARYIELFYNPIRKHSFLSYKSPAQFENLYETIQADAA